MRIDVHFDRSVHGDDAEAADDLGRVGDLLGAEKELRVVIFPLALGTGECQWLAFEGRKV